VNDAGGAEILSSIAKKYKDKFNWYNVVTGPAKGIFRNKGILCHTPIIINYDKARLLIKDIKPDFVITGTGWSTNMEKYFMRAAKALGIKSASYLDSWFNYKERFGGSKSWKGSLPDFIFIGDAYAYRLALKSGFPRKKIRNVENPLWEQFLKKGAKKRGDGVKRNILYLAGAASSRYRRWALKAGIDISRRSEVSGDIIDAVKAAGPLFRLRVRPHPSDRQYRGQGTGDRGQGRENGRRKLEDDIRWADVVVGAETMALAIAAAMGKKTISYLPEGKAQCRLPLKDIIKVTSKGALRRQISDISKTSQSAFMMEQVLFNKRHRFDKIMEGLF